MAKQPPPPLPRGKPPASSGPPRNVGGPPPGKKPAARRVRDEDSTLKVTARYFSSARHQRVSPLVVEADNPPGAVPVTVRPVIPGALVVPPELLLQPGKTVSFDVTPLARGTLKGARVDLAAPGKPTASVPLRIKTGSQRATWVMLLLTLLLPALLAYYTDPLYGRLKGMVPREGIVANAPAVQIPAGGGPAGPPMPPGGPPMPPGDPGPMPPGGGDGPGQPPPPGGGAPPPPSMPNTTGKSITMSMAGPGEYVAYHIDHILSYHLPNLTDDQRAPVVDSINSTADSLGVKGIDPKKSVVAGLVGGAYEFLCNLESVKPAFSLFVGMSVLTLLCWVTHWRRRGYSSKRLDLVPAVDGSAETLNVPVRPPLEVMPVD